MFPNKRDITTYGIERAVDHTCHQPASRRRHRTTIPTYLSPDHISGALRYVKLAVERNPCGGFRSHWNGRARRPRPVGVYFQVVKLNRTAVSGAASQIQIPYTQGPPPSTGDCQPPRIHRTYTEVPGLESNTTHNEILLLITPTDVFARTTGQLLNQRSATSKPERHRPSHRAPQRPPEGTPKHRRLVAHCYKVRQGKPCEPHQRSTHDKFTASFAQRSRASKPTRN